MAIYNPYIDSINVLATDVNGPSYLKESSEIRLVLEDANSPVTRKFQEKMYKSIIDKAHIDFGDIPVSKGNIRNYKGYNTMCETLNVISKLAQEDKAPNVEPPKTSLLFVAAITIIPSFASNPSI